MSSRKKRFFVVVVAVLAVLLVAVNQSSKRKAAAALRDYSAQFSQDGTPNATRLTMQRVYFGVEKRSHGVLLIHGIPSSSSTFSGLCERLEDEGIPFIAPTLTGFGNTELNLLPHVSFEDWLRDSMNAYDTLAQAVEEISIVSTSTGSLIATWLSEQRDVENLVLIVPNFSPGPSASRFKTILETPVASQLLRGLMPYRLSDPEEYSDTSRFRYPLHEVGSVQQMFLLQDEVRPEDIRVKRGVFLMSGSRDTKVSTDNLEPILEKVAHESGVQYESFGYDAAHGLLQGAVAEGVESQIVKILRGHIPED